MESKHKDVSTLADMCCRTMLHHLMRRGFNCATELATWYASEYFQHDKYIVIQYTTSRQHTAVGILKMSGWSIVPSKCTDALLLLFYFINHSPNYNIQWQNVKINYQHN